MNDHECGVMRTNTFLSHGVSVHHSVCALCRRKMTCEVFLSTHSVGYSRSPSAVKETNCNKKKELTSHELHQLLDVSQSHQESLEEECHILYCWGDIGSAISSPDSRWRRFSSGKTAARKSGRSRIGAFWPDLFHVRYHCPWYLLNSSLERWYV